MSHYVQHAIPERLANSCAGNAERQAWLSELPGLIDRLCSHWSLFAGAPFESGSCSWTAPALHMTGRQVVLKIGMPHPEGADEIEGLRFWSGDPTVLVIDADKSSNAMILEHCSPGTSLASDINEDHDVILAGLLRRLWRVPSSSVGFRHLSAMAKLWAEETRLAEPRWPDRDLIEEGLRLFAELAAPSEDDALLATDLHAGNVLRATREPWLVIDPKPFIGDRAYDATQHLLNSPRRLHADPIGTVQRFADLLEVDEYRVRKWVFAREVAEPRDHWCAESLTLARVLHEHL